jgi:hypothetical protein
MLKIRPEQMKVFQPVAEAAFAREIVEELREEHADTVVHLPTGTFAIEQIADDALLELVKTGIARAREYGITWECTLAAFVVLMFVVAPNFDQHPLIQRVLRDESVGPDSRIDQLWERTSEENWQAAIQSYDASAWQLRLQE